MNGPTVPFPPHTGAPFIGGWVSRLLPLDVTVRALHKPFHLWACFPGTAQTVISGWWLHAESAVGVEEAPRSQVRLGAGAFR